MRHRLLSLRGLPLCGLVFFGCEPNPCDFYVDYMCDCHDGEEGVDCATLERTYENASSALQDECAIALEDQEDEDLENGHECQQ